MKKFVVALVVIAMMISTLSLVSFAGTYEKPMKAQKINEAPVIDGVFDAENWGSPIVTNTAKEVLAAYDAGEPSVASFGFDVLNADARAILDAYAANIKTETYMRWADDALYLCSIIYGMGTSHKNTVSIEDQGNIWGQDNVQHMFVDIANKEDVLNGNSEIGYALNSELSVPMKWKWADYNGVGFENVTLAVKKTAESMVYESKIPWVEVGLDIEAKEGNKFAYSECFNFSVPGADAFAADPAAITAARFAIESMALGSILNGKNAINCEEVELTAAPAIVVEEPAAEEVVNDNPETSDGILAVMVVLAFASACVAVVSTRKFCK